MALEVLLWLVSFFISLALLALVFYQLICLSDLEYDYINPYDSSSRINAVVVPEFVIQGAVCVLFLITWHWFMFLIMVPVTYFHIKLYMQRKHLIDVTEIFRLLNDEKKIRLVKLVFYLTLLFITIYRWYFTATGNGLKHHYPVVPGSLLLNGFPNELGNGRNLALLGKNVRSHLEFQSRRTASISLLLLVLALEALKSDRKLVKIVDCQNF